MTDVPDSAAPITRTFLRGLSVLEALAAVDSEGGLGVTEAAAAVGLDKATAARLLNTLCATGYAYQDPATRRYALTSKILALGNAYRTSLDLPVRANPHLGELRAASDETVHLGICEMDRIVYIAKLETQRPVQIASAIGQTMPIHTTSLGKAILAATPEVQREEIIARLDLAPRTERSITTVAELRADLEHTRHRGYAIDDRENEDAITCVGAAIVDAAGEVRAAVSISGPSYRIDERTDDYGELCRKAATAIGASL